MRQPKGQVGIIELNPVTPSVINGLAFGAMEAVRRAFKDEENRRKFEQWYKERYGREYHWLTLREVHDKASERPQEAAN